MECRGAAFPAPDARPKDGMAKLYFHYATMNAGKTTMLLQAAYNYRERGMTTMLFVAGHYRKGDTRLISSRIGLEAEAEMFRDGDDLFARVAEHHDHTTVHGVFVDEAQFLEEEQVWQLARIADRLDIPVSATACALTSRAICFPARARCSPSPTNCARCAPSAAAAARRRWWCGWDRTARSPGRANRSPSARRPMSRSAAGIGKTRWAASARRLHRLHQGLKA